MKIVFRAMIVIVLAATGQAHAMSPPPPLPIGQLTEFYYAMDGDNWYRNDGWLDADIDVCDWYGIRCTVLMAGGGFNWIGEITLPDNNLSGSIEDTDILHIVSTGLNLSGNRISGRLGRIPLALERIDLSRNRLTGTLPEAEDFGYSRHARHDMARLNLAYNQFEGEIPATWEALELAALDLTGNLLFGSPERAFLAMGQSGPHLIRLADNPFSGVLPDWLPDLELELYDNDFGGLNLCWTDLSIVHEVLADWVAAHHVGGADYAYCLGRERLTLDPTVSGSWYDPGRSGEGLSLMLLEDGRVLGYWFTHISRNRQTWLFAVGHLHEFTLDLPAMMRTAGAFGQGFANFEQPAAGRAELRLDRLGKEQLLAEYRLFFTNRDLDRKGQVQLSTIIPALMGRLQDHRQLTRLAGSRCDNQHSLQWVSGAWYNPELSGEGFVIEVNEDGQGVVYWFTYAPGGPAQAWMMGIGEFVGNMLIIDRLIQPQDLDDGMPIDSDGIEPVDWGELTIDFHDDLNAQVQYESELGEFGSGEYPLKRLARPLLAECE